MTVRFSVVIPLYNKATHIRRALDSVLAQRCTDFEILVVNDGSTDGGERQVEALDDPRIRLINQPNQGVSAARNNGVALANGPYVAFLDADDAWLPHFLDEINRLIDASPDSAMFATAYQTVENGRINPRSSASRISRRQTQGVFLDYLDCLANDIFPFCASCICVNKRIFRQTTGFDRSLQIGDDIEMWVRLSLISTTCFSPVVSALYHRDAENRAMDCADREDKEIRWIRKLLHTFHSARLSDKQTKNYRRLISYLVFRCGTRFFRRGERARARRLRDEFGDILLARHAVKLLGRRLQSYVQHPRPAATDE